MTNDFLNLLGLAKRAGKVTTGEDLCKKAVQKGISRLIIIAGDASDNTKKSIINSCKYYNVKYITAADKTEIGKYTGTLRRAVASVNDDNFARAILDRLEKSKGEKKG